MPKRRCYLFSQASLPRNPLPRSTTLISRSFVDSTYEGTEPYGSNGIVLADCNCRVEIDFYLGVAEARKLSLYKVEKVVQNDPAIPRRAW